jgi:hypothetical protein
MSLSDLIKEAFPELTSFDFDIHGGNKVILCDDGDGDVYIAAWNHDKPLTAELASYLR